MFLAVTRNSKLFNLSTSSSFIRRLLICEQEGKSTKWLWSYWYLTWNGSITVQMIGRCRIQEDPVYKSLFYWIHRFTARYPHQWYFYIEDHLVPLFFGFWCFSNSYCWWIVYTVSMINRIYWSQWWMASTDVNDECIHWSQWWMYILIAMMNGIYWCNWWIVKLRPSLSIVPLLYDSFVSLTAVTVTLFSKRIYTRSEDSVLIFVVGWFMNNINWCHWQITYADAADESHILMLLMNHICWCRWWITYADFADESHIPILLMNHMCWFRWWITYTDISDKRTYCYASSQMHVSSGVCMETTRQKHFHNIPLTIWFRISPFCVYCQIW